MKTIKQYEAVHDSNLDGMNDWCYRRDEYELHYDEQLPGTRQIWHHHDVITETLFILEGQLTAEWKKGEELKTWIVGIGDLIETEDAPHTFFNHTDKIARFIVIKQVPSGINNQEIIKNDKIIDKP